MKRDLNVGDDTERMCEWGAYFRDRRRWETCKSLESKFQPGSDDYVREGWGEPEKPPAPPPRARDWVLRAMAVQDAMTALSKADGGRKYVWALTYAYAYPSLPKFVVLRLMKKYTGRRLAWNAFRDLVDIGRIRVWSLICTQQRSAA